MTLSVYYDREKEQQYVMWENQPRFLARIPTYPNFAKYARFEDNLHVLPASQWVTINRRNQFGPDKILDQMDKSSCVGFSTAATMGRVAALTGQPWQRFSGTYPYAHINGGRDRGAMITDAVGVIRSKGICLESEMGPQKIYLNEIPSDAHRTAARFRALETYIAATWHEICSAIQLGFIPVFAVQVGNNFSRLDSSGVAGYDRGPGNHAVCADGMTKMGNEWFLDMANSWGSSWGDQGRCYLSRSHIDSVMQDCYVLRSIQEDPVEPNPPIAA